MPKPEKSQACALVLFFVANKSVIPTGAKRSGGICSSTDPSWKCFTNFKP